MEHSDHGQSTLGRRKTRPAAVVAVLGVLTVIALLAGSACAGGSVPPDRLEAQWPRGGTPGIPDVTGVIELLLVHNGGGQATFKAMVEAEGDGLADNTLYSLWLADREGHLVQIDSGRADEECEADPDTGEEGDECIVELHLRGQMQPAPFEATTLLGLTATVREGLGSTGTLERTAVVLSFTVTEADL